MRHIRFISTNETVCEKSEMLGDDFVVQDFAPDDDVGCEVCFGLLAVHNIILGEE